MSWVLVHAKCTLRNRQISIQSLESMQIFKRSANANTLLSIIIGLNMKISLLYTFIFFRYCFLTFLPLQGYSYNCIFIICNFSLLCPFSCWQPIDFVADVVFGIILYMLIKRRNYLNGVKPKRSKPESCINCPPCATMPP